MTRRIVRILIIALTIAFIGLSSGVRSQVLNYRTKQKPPPLEIVKVANGIYLAKGEWGSNVGFCTWNNEVLVIDSKATKGATEKVLKEIAKISKNPITRVVFTHSDPDSFNGRDAYPDTAEIICSPRVLDDHKKNTTVYLEMNAPAALYASWSRSDFIPAMTFKGELNIRLGQDEVTLLHYGPAHTSGDTIVWFPADRVAFIGDLVFDGREPMIQDQKGGSSYGLVRALSILLDLRPEIRTFIPCHGDPLDRAIVQQNLRMIEEVQSKVTAMFDAGKSLEDVKTAFGVKDPPQEDGAWIWPSLAVTVYQELNRKKF